MNNSMAIFKTNNLENIIDKNMASILYELISVSLNLCYMNRHWDNGCKDMVFHLYKILHVFSNQYL